MIRQQSLYVIVGHGSVNVMRSERMRENAEWINLVYISGLFQRNITKRNNSYAMVVKKKFDLLYKKAVLDRQE
jgi:hypothetical protein